MRKFLILLSILFLGFGTINIFAQKKAKPRKVVIFEISVPNFGEPYKEEILINQTPKAKYEFDGGGSSSCYHCDKNEDSSYSFTLRAFRMGKNKANVGFEIEIDKKCKTRKIFKVYQNQPTKLQLNCGVILTAYYGFESKKAN